MPPRVTVIGTRKAFPYILGMPFDSSRYTTWHATFFAQATADVMQISPLTSPSILAHLQLPALQLYVHKRGEGRDEQRPKCLQCAQQGR